MQVFDITFNSLAEVSPVSLAEAVVTMKEVHLQNTQLTPEQSQRLVDAIRYAEVKTLQVLNLQENNLEHVVPASLADMAVTLTRLNLGSTGLTADQCQRLMDGIRHAEVKTLKTLNVWGNLLTEVDPVSLAEALLTLTDVELQGTDMTLEQCEILLDDIIIFNDQKRLNLKTLRFVRNDILQFVHPGLIADCLLYTSPSPRD